MVPLVVREKWSFIENNMVVGGGTVTPVGSGAYSIVEVAGVYRKKGAPLAVKVAV